VSAPAGIDGIAETHQAVRALLREGRIHIPNHERLIRQMRELTYRPTSDGKISFASPHSRDGSHGDILSAMILAVWSASKGLALDVPPDLSNPETKRQYEADQWRRRILDDQEGYESRAREDAWSAFE
jgi:hypothetical protein